MRCLRAIILAAWFVVASVFAATGVTAQTPPPSDDSYTSPTYGYTIPLDDEWTVESTESENGVDVLRMTNGPIVVFVTGFPSDLTPAECIEDMAATVQERPGHSNLVFTTPIEAGDDSAFAVIGYMFLTQGGELLEGRNRITCWSLEEQGALVRLELLMLSRDAILQRPTITALESEVANAVLAVQSQTAAPATAATVETTPTATSTTAPSPTSTATNEPAQTPPATIETTPTATPPATIEATSTPAVRIASSQTPAPTVESTPTPAATTEPPTPTATATVEPTQTPTATTEPAPTQPATTGTSGLDPSGTSYTSPTYGYGLSWDDTFTVSDVSSDATGDYLGLDSESGIFIDLIGEAFDATQTTSCFEWLGDFYEQEPEYSAINPSPDPVSTHPGLWEMTGVITMTYTSPDDGSATDLVNYAACSTIPDQGAVVTLEQVTRADQFGGQTTLLMDAVRASFVPVASTGAQTTTGTATPVTVAGDTADYTSATFGYTLSWDDSWSIVEETTDPAGDYIRITNGPVYADLLSEPWDPAFAGSCFDLIVDYYFNNAEYADVRGVEDPTSLTPGVWDTTGVMSLTFLNTSDGEPLPLINSVACSVDEARNFVVSLEQWTEPASTPDQVETMNTLRAGFTLE